MQKKTKKRLIIIGIIAMVLIGILLLGYFCVNMGFSLLGDSFYQSDVLTADFEQSTIEGNDSSQNQPDAADAPGTSGETDASGKEPNADGKSSGQGERSLPFARLNLSAEEFKALQKKVPFSDKMAVLGILSTSLSAADYTELIGMLSGGITSSEVKRAYQIVSRGLSSEDKEKIWGYYDKYKHLIQ